ncbi:hypothetical protein [Amycolatopsis pittospori]|uniref:hypothetical protein n=1 Tax=Amycolatopsis pittospori TaxID=2749434 RepID=UPI0015F08701|nr:hypothetical protein [Amycolatopsis pittospori]
MGAEIEGVDDTPDEMMMSWEGTPTRLARVRIETSELKAEAAVPASQTHRLLTTILDTLVVFGAVLGPALTLQVVPATFPTWATAGTIAGQLAMLALVARSVHHREETDPRPAN